MTATDLFWCLEKTLLYWTILLITLCAIIFLRKKTTSKAHTKICRVPSSASKHLKSEVILKWFRALVWIGFFHVCVGDTTRESSNALYLFILVRSDRFIPVLYHNSSVSESPFHFHWSEHRKRIIEIFCTKVCLGHHRARTSTGKWIYSS